MTQATTTTITTATTTATPTKSETWMTASVLKQDTNTYKVKTFWGNPLYQATKRHLTIKL